MKPAAKVYTALIMLFLFAPIAILLVFFCKFYIICGSISHLFWI